MRVRHYDWADSLRYLNDGGAPSMASAAGGRTVDMPLAEVADARAAAALGLAAQESFEVLATITALHPRLLEVS